MQMLKFTPISPSNHLISKRAQNTDFLDHKFNSIRNILNRLKGQELGGGDKNVEWRLEEHQSHQTSCLTQYAGLRVSRDQNCSHGVPYLPPCIPQCKLPAHQSLDIFWARKKKKHTWSIAPGYYAVSIGLGKFLFLRILLRISPTRKHIWPSHCRSHSEFLHSGTKINSEEQKNFSIKKKVTMNRPKVVEPTGRIISVSQIPI